MSLYKENRNFVDMICSYLKSRVDVWSGYEKYRVGDIVVPVFDDVGYLDTVRACLYFKPTKNIIIEERRGKLLYIGLELKSSKNVIFRSDDIYYNAWSLIDHIISYGFYNDSPQKVKAREEFYEYVRKKYSKYSNSKEEDIRQECMDTEGKLVKDSPYIKKAIDFLDKFYNAEFEFSRQNVFKEINNKKLIPICYMDFDKMDIYFLQYTYNKPTERNCFDSESFAPYLSTYNWSQKGKRVLEDIYRYIPESWVNVTSLDPNIKLSVY